MKIKTPKSVGGILVLSAMLLSSCSRENDFDINHGWTFSEIGSESVSVVDLPHDAMLRSGRSADVPGGDAVGYFRSGRYSYQKDIEVPQSWMQKHVTLYFGGVYRDAVIFLNGEKIATHDYGYGSFCVNLDGQLVPGKNTIRVECGNEGGLDSRWYSGAGIYRRMELRVSEKDHIEKVKVLTESINPPAVRIVTAHTGGNVGIGIFRDGKKVAEASGDNALVEIPDAHLWSADSPDLYTAVVSLEVNGKKTDSREETFGIRTLEWNSEGFFVNGERTLLKGSCLHSDNGILGMAEYQDAADRKIRTLKEYGFNAIRSAHNPCSEEILRACDKYGMYVMDELWDMWFVSKNKNDYANKWKDGYLTDIKEMVAKDYNHPSVVMYSIGNEVGEPGSEEGMRYAMSIINSLHSLDPSRPVTGGINLMLVAMKALGGFDFNMMLNTAMDSKAFNDLVQKLGPFLYKDAILTDDWDKAVSPIMDSLDIAGYNYGTMRYELDNTLHPDRLIVGSETYQRDLWDTWAVVEKNPGLIGDFVWTGWDYLGEVGIGAFKYGERQTGRTTPYPWKLADCGTIDINGNPTGEAFLSTVTWEETPGKPHLAVMPVRKDEPISRSQWRLSDSIPSWSWNGEDGTTAHVEAYSSADKVEFFLNGESLGKKNVEKGVAKIDIPYNPGKLEAVAYLENGTVCGKDELTSAEGSLALSIEPESDTVIKGHLAFVEINIVGENGEVESNADRKISLSVEGGKLLGFGSSLPMTEDDFLSGEYTSRYGRTLAIISPDRSGKVKITANAEGLSPASRTIRIK